MWEALEILSEKYVTALFSDLKRLKEQIMMESTEWDTIVVGGGASGLAAAVTAARMGEKTLLIEKQDRLGRKLLATGNGRCNLMHLGDLRYYGEAGFARQVISRCGAMQQRHFWQELGLHLRTVDGVLVYPATFQASSVLDALRFGIERYGVQVKLQCPVTDLVPGKDRISVLTGKEQITGKRCILAAGGCAGPRLGGSEFSNTVLQRLGFITERPFPALTPLETDHLSISGLSGLRIFASLRFENGKGRCLHTEKGEVLFTDYGVSGICVMQCARFLSGDACELSLNLLLPLGLSDDQLAQEFEERAVRFRDMTPDMLLKGMLPAKMSYAVCKQAGIPMRGETLKDLKSSQRRLIIRRAADYRLKITGTRGFDQAQVTAGGVLCSQFFPETLASRKCPVLHVTGEALNVDGDCGGYNLMFAFASGILAGLNGRENPF